MDVSLGRSAIQMSHKSSDLIPCFSLSYQDRDERVPQGVVAVQLFETHALDTCRLSSGETDWISLVGMDEAQQGRTGGFQTIYGFCGRIALSME